jgi:uncharacterized LabA/DUF88 family protein
MPLAVRISFYIDGFNFYYGAIRRFPGTHWLDFDKFCCRFLPSDGEMASINYFTAVVDTPPETRDRHRVYLAALRSIPHLTVYRGRFRTDEKWTRLVDPQPIDAGGRGAGPGRSRKPLAQVGLPRYAWAWKNEEKGSDVNLAVRLVVDMFEDRFDGAVVVSNDTDLVMAIEAVRSRGKPVWVVNPRGERHPQLTPDEQFHRRLRGSHLYNSLLPDVVQLPSGAEVVCPQKWVDLRPRSGS